MKAAEYQKKVFIDGLSGVRPPIPHTWEKLADAARFRLDAEARDYIFGGAGRGATMAQNEASLARWALVPRMMKGVVQPDLATRVLGLSLTHPLIASPVGVLEMVHPDADLALAEACRQTGTLMVISSQASRPVEDIVRVLGDSPRWFQLYWNREERVVQSFVKRAEDSGCSAIVLTVDTVMPGWRTADLDSGYLPFLHGRGLAQYATDPVFRELAEAVQVDRQPGQKISLNLVMGLLAQSRNLPGGFLYNLSGKRAVKLIRLFSETFPHRFLNWDAVEKLKRWTSLPVVIKGLQHMSDASEAVARGADALWVSNHGGRQVDGAIGSFDGLHLIRGCVRPEVPVFFDSGIRSGADAMKALGSGAWLTGIGRPYVCGLALRGADGAAGVFNQMRCELETAMVLSGAGSLNEIPMPVRM